VALAVDVSTLVQAGTAGVANSTGFTTGGYPITGLTGFNAGNAPPANPTVGVPSTIPSVLQNSGLTASGTVSVQEGAIPATVGGLAVNLPITAGGGLFRGFQQSGPDVTTFLNAAGATTGTQIEIAVSSMPAGSSVTFPATISSSSGQAVVNMSLVGNGTISSPGGTVTYVTTINEGTPYALTGGLPTTGPSLDVPFTVTEGASGGAVGTAKAIIRVRPNQTGTDIPRYAEVQGSSVIPSQLIPTVGQYALFTILSNQTTRLFPYVVTTGGTTIADYDTGVVVANTGKAYSSITNTLSTVGGQDGTFTIYLVDASQTVKSIKSDASNFPGASALSSGKLLMGSTWQALGSEIAKAVGITGAFKGYMLVVTDFPNSQGFAFISQFTNPDGGATMGYVALQQGK